MSELLIIIPAFNEEGNIQKVVGDLKKDHPEFDYVIIEDGSSDDTLKVCRENRFNVIPHPVNLGLSCAIKTGMKYAYGKGYEYVLQFDADGQHLPEYIGAMLDEIKNGYDVVIGSRFCDEKKPRSLRMLGSNMIALAIKLTTGKSIKDPTSGMRMYNRKCVELLMNDSNFGPEPDVIAFIIKNGLKVREVQVKMQERISGESYLRFGSSAAYMIRQLVSILILQNYKKRGV